MKDDEYLFITKFSKEYCPDCMDYHHLAIILAVFLQKYKDRLKK